MVTVPRLQLGPVDHGRTLTLEEFEETKWQPGFQYELIDGRLDVLPMPGAAGGILEHWLLMMKLSLHVLARPDVINFPYNKPRIFVWDRPGVTIPEPDVAAYRDFRHGKRWRVKTVSDDDTYTAKLFPGFELIIDPRR
jgi:hypothetical protein